MITAQIASNRARANQFYNNSLLWEEKNYGIRKGRPNGTDNNGGNDNENNEGDNASADDDERSRNGDGNTHTNRVERGIEGKDVYDSNRGNDDENDEGDEARTDDEESQSNEDENTQINGRKQTDLGASEEWTAEEIICLGMIKINELESELYEEMEHKQDLNTVDRDEECEDKSRKKENIDGTPVKEEMTKKETAQSGLVAEKPTIKEDIDEADGATDNVSEENIETRPSTRELEEDFEGESTKLATQDERSTIPIKTTEVLMMKRSRKFQRKRRNTTEKKQKKTILILKHKKGTDLEQKTKSLRKGQHSLKTEKNTYYREKRLTKKQKLTLPRKNPRRKMLNLQTMRKEMEIMEILITISCHRFEDITHHRQQSWKDVIK